jgi:hypothetical protein
MSREPDLPDDRARLGVCLGAAALVEPPPRTDPTGRR